MPLPMAMINCQWRTDKVESVDKLIRIVSELRLERMAMAPHDTWWMFASEESADCMMIHVLELYYPAG